MSTGIITFRENKHTVESDVTTEQDVETLTESPIAYGPDTETATVLSGTGSFVLKVPNDETLKAAEATRNRIGITYVRDSSELFKDLDD